jgi:hypothetical protein
VTWSRGDLRVRDPQSFLPLSLLACAHCHARILRRMAVDYENLFRRGIQTFTTGC